VSSTPPTGGGEDLRERSFADLTKQLSSDVSALVRQELELARAEMTQKGKRAGLGAGLLGGASLIALGAFGALTAFLILVLGLVMPDWLSALIVALVYGAVAAVLALRGRREVQAVGKPIPEQTVESVKEDAQWAKTHARSSSR
jgi:hypothetical protein